jgi:tRNA-splicing ligase RtcB
MSEPKQTELAPVRQWLAMPMDADVRQVIERIRRADDVVRVAVMPDVHLAGEICVGVAMATRKLIYPSAVGGDIGCGMLAIAFDSSGEIVRDAAHAGAILRHLGERIPALRRNRSQKLAFPRTLDVRELSHSSLQSIAGGIGQLEFGTLGSGNHFVEFQADESDQLWLMIHSGSRAIGQAVKQHHVASATAKSASLALLDSDSTGGQAYLKDQEWARRFAAANRWAMARDAMEILGDLFKIDSDESMAIECDHNHVRREEHMGQLLFVHRKGAMPADAGSPGVVPGSMGTLSLHVEGRGCAESLRSSAHGAGRLYSRHAARQRFSRGDLRQQMQNVWFDLRLGEALREESPGSYKDIGSVMRAQSELVKITRTLRPLLVYKGR